MKEECTYGMQTFGKYSLNEFIKKGVWEKKKKKGVWKAWVIIVGDLIEDDFSFHNSWQCLITFVMIHCDYYHFIYK